MLVQIAAALFIAIVVNTYVQINGGWKPFLIGFAIVGGFLAFLIACFIFPAQTFIIALGLALIFGCAIADPWFKRNGYINPLERKTDWRIVNDARAQWEMERKYGKRIV